MTKFTGLAGGNREQILDHGFKLAHTFVDYQKIVCSWWFFPLAHRDNRAER